MDPAQVFDDLTGVMKANHISMPSSLTMLARGLATIEGLVVRLNPDLNVMNVVTSRIGGNLLRNIDWRTELAQDARALYDSAHKSLEIPALMADVMRTGLKGEANLGIEHHIGTDWHSSCAKSHASCAWQSSAQHSSSVGELSTVQNPW